MKIKKSSLQLFLLLVIAISIIAALIPASRRYGAEAANHKVAVLLDFGQVKEMALKENISLPQLLAKLKPHIQGLVLKDQTIADLEADGTAFLQTAQQLQWETKQEAFGNLPSTWQCLVFSDQSQLERVKANIIAKAAPQTVVKEITVPASGYSVLATSLTKTQLAALGLGFDQNDLQVIQAAGLGIVIQMRSWPIYSEEGLKLLLNTVKDNKVLAFGFNDNDLPSASGPAADWSKAAVSISKELKTAGYPLLWVEFFNQNGLAAVAGRMNSNILRLHAISEQQMLTMSENTAIDRFQLAASERNIRLVFVRFLPKASLEANIAYIAKIDGSILAKGLQLGDPVQNFSGLRVRLAIVGLVTLGIAAGGALLFSLVGFPKSGLLVGALGFCGVMGLAVSGHGVLARQTAALAAVIIFPVLSLWIWTPRKKQSLSKACLLVAITTLCSLIGALLMVGVLSDGSFMVKIQEFSGVKVAHLLPLLMIGLFFWLFWQKKRNGSAIEKVQWGLNQPIMVKHVICGMIAAAVLILFLLRTGNDNAAVSGIELTFRNFLDQILGIRPRTKEFLCGMPFLLITYYYGYHKDIRLPLLLLGAIGQISLVNTFAHIHTPIAISLWRTINGLWLGLLFGMLFLAVWKVVVFVWKKYVSSEQEKANER